MLVSKWTEITNLPSPKCCACDSEATVKMHGYAEDNRDIFLCSDHALQLVRKITEDLCELLTKGGRHG
jgi:hypothetical protein